MPPLYKMSKQCLSLLKKMMNVSRSGWTCSSIVSIKSWGKQNKTKAEITKNMAQFVFIQIVLSVHIQIMYSYSVGRVHTFNEDNAFFENPRCSVDLVLLFDSIVFESCLVPSNVTHVYTLTHNRDMLISVAFWSPSR